MEHGSLDGRPSPPSTIITLDIDIIAINGYDDDDNDDDMIEEDLPFAGKYRFAV